MTAQTKSNLVSFRAWPVNHFAIQRAGKIGFNVSELLNEVVSKHLKRQIALKAAARSRALRSLKAAKLTPKSRR